MSHAKREKLVYTVPDRCRVCYTCVRECPVKAIKIINGQATIMSARCIGCGSCLKVCSQGAKAVINTKPETISLLEENKNVIACVAPSFAAEFTEFDDHRQFVGMLKELGFSKVVEVSFGADLVALKYKELSDKRTYISSDCPAIVFYIEHYMPEIVDSLAPIVSPMVAITRVLREKYGKTTKIVFIGPCVAKKAESDEIDVALTFRELREILLNKNIDPHNVELSDFDPPFSGKGSIFPVSRGLLNTMGENEDLFSNNVIVAAGTKNFIEALREYDEGVFKGKNLELLSCEGCIMGPGMSPNGKLYMRRNAVSEYVNNKLSALDENEFKKQLEEFKHIDLSQSFQNLDRRVQKPSSAKIVDILQAMGKFEPKDLLNCGACGYETCYSHAEAIIQGFAEIDMCLPHSIERLHKSIDQLNVTNEKLSDARQALIQSEKLANMGQLSAGIAHELNNPLGVITMYSNLLMEEMPSQSENYKDLQLIVEQAERCKKIVGGLLNFARKNQVKSSEVNMVDFCKHSLDITIHPENISLEFNSNITDPIAFIDKDQMMQVLTNLLKNSVEAIPSGGKIVLNLSGDEYNIFLEVKDNGCGIAEENMDKIFMPFFTTKGLGKGTGLGLPLIYGIIKMHKGDITVKSNNNPEKGETGTIFKIRIPRITLN